jgi:2-polyprenyl-6-methoxyphenol hydroxylase-like FAD-dependent oxidoreductase
MKVPRPNAISAHALSGLTRLPGAEDNRRDLSVAEPADLFPHATGPPAGFKNVMRANPTSYYANIHQVVDEWTRNRVTLMGDAAHAMSPIRAQGTGVGLEDAALLAELLTTPDLPVPTALASYEKLRKPDAQEMQRASYEAGRRIGNRTVPTDLFPDFIAKDSAI